jgi:RNA polymerase sigma-70 factor (ECF subfamily)
MDSSPGTITELLGDLRNGDQQAQQRLAPLVYDELHKIAARHMRRERPEHTLQPTALVNEAYMRLVEPGREWKDRLHFFALACQIMRRILVDHARQHRAEKRGGDWRKVTLDAIPLASDLSFDQILALDEALSRLAEWDARQGRVVELRFFGGLTEDEIAEVLGVSARSVKRDWKLARAWLYGQIGN